MLHTTKGAAKAAPFFVRHGDEAAKPYSSAGAGVSGVARVMKAGMSLPNPTTRPPSSSRSRRG